MVDAGTAARGAQKFPLAASLSISLSRAEAFWRVHREACKRRELPQRLMEINALNDTPVILVWPTKARSAAAAVLFREAGFGGFRSVRGGLERCNRNNLASENGAGPEQLRTGFTTMGTKRAKA